MLLSSKNDPKLYDNFEEIGLKSEIKNSDVLIKINLGTYQKNRPRTDMTLLKKVVTYIYSNGGKCAITEGCSGFLTENLITLGFEDILEQCNIKVIDVDLEECDEVISYGEYHYIPKCFREYPVRIAIPATSKRNDMLYSNNIKLFFGAVPRKMYQLDDSDVPIDVPRPKLHQNLHLSVANLFLAIKSYSEFQYYINGGLAYNENIGEFILSDTFVGNNALELDLHMFHVFFSDCEYPNYLEILKTRLFKV
jgi:hypothetical protein